MGDYNFGWTNIILPRVFILYNLGILFFHVDFVKDFVKEKEISTL